MKSPVCHPRIICLLLCMSLILTLPLSSCSQKSDPSNTQKPGPSTIPSANQKSTDQPGQLIQALASADTADKRQQAVQTLVQSGLSLGLIDDSGRQLNTQTPDALVSMGPLAVEVYAMLAADGAGRQLGSIIDFLKASGVVLHATQKAIDASSLLPDIQKYVDWSFKNKNDPKATLGLLLASGPTMQIPNSAPKLSAETWVSPLAGILLMADILIGVPADTPAKADTGSRFSLAKLWSAQPVAASGLQETAKTLQGLITIISPMLPKETKIPEVVHTILAAFALGDRVVLRTVDPASLNLDPMPDIRKIELKPKLNQGVQLVPVVMLIPSRKILQGVEITVTVDLVAPSRALGSAAGTLYPDADATLVSFQGRNPSVQMDGHRLKITGRPPMDPAGFSVNRSLAKNEKEQAALLYATAEAQLPQLSEVLAKYDAELAKLGFFAQKSAAMVLSRQEVEKYYQDIQSGLKVAALAYPVILLPRDQAAGLSFETEGTLVSGLQTQFKPLPDGQEKMWPFDHQWVWNWGDGTAETVSSRIERPIHTYEKSGTYTVQFSARNSETKEILASGEQQLVITDLPAITERTSTGISYHLFEKTDAQIPILIKNQMTQSELWILQLCSFEAPIPSWDPFPTFRVVYKSQVLNYSPPNQPPSYLSRSVTLKIRYANEVAKKNVSYTHGQDTGTLIGNEWILITESNKKRYATIIQQAEVNKQSRLVEGSLEENRMRFIYMNSPKSSLQANSDYQAAHVERYGSCTIEIGMSYPSPDDETVRQVLNAMVDYAHELAKKAEGNAGRYIAAFTKR